MYPADQPAVPLSRGNAESSSEMLNRPHSSRHPLRRAQLYAAPGYGAAPPASRVAAAIATRPTCGPPLTLTPEPLRLLTQQRHGQAHDGDAPGATLQDQIPGTSLDGLGGLPVSTVRALLGRSGDRGSHMGAAIARARGNGGSEPILTARRRDTLIEIPR